MNNAESDNHKIALNSTPFIIDNRLYVSLHALGEVFGAMVAYNKSDHTMHVTTELHHAVFWSGSSIMMFDGKRREIGSPVVTREGRTQVPLRFIASLFNWEVYWENNTILLARAPETDARSDRD